MKNRHFHPSEKRLALSLLCGVVLMTTVLPVSGAEAALGRLFFSAERRQQLDRQRAQNTLDKQQATAAPALTVDGVVVRSSGRRTTWLNGTPQHESEMLNGLTLTGRPDEPARVLVESSDAPSARARVGETVNRSTGETSDLLKNGQIVIRTPNGGRR
ncbi:MAG TPA: hypothetical protein PKY22_01310 [Accumulibacter sp.]|nr:hypothetical protein [Accumulibacter sp.]